MQNLNSASSLLPADVGGTKSDRRLSCCCYPACSLFDQPCATQAMQIPMLAGESSPAAPGSTRSAPGNGPSSRDFSPAQLPLSARLRQSPLQQPMQGSIQAGSRLRPGARSMAPGSMQALSFFPSHSALNSNAMEGYRAPASGPQQPMANGDTAAPLLPVHKGAGFAAERQQAHVLSPRQPPASMQAHQPTAPMHQQKPQSPPMVQQRQQTPQSPPMMQQQQQQSTPQSPPMVQQQQPHSRSSSVSQQQARLPPMQQPQSLPQQPHAFQPEQQQSLPQAPSSQQAQLPVQELQRMQQQLQAMQQQQQHLPQQPPQPMQQERPQPMEQQAQPPQSLQDAEGEAGTGLPQQQGSHASHGRAASADSSQQRGSQGSRPPGLRVVVPRAGRPRSDGLPTNSLRSQPGSATSVRVLPFLSRLDEHTGLLLLS